MWRGRRHSFEPRVYGVRAQGGSMKRLVQLAAVALFLALGGGTAALTPAQCQFFSDNGVTEICHATRSPRHPYVLLRASEQACIAHSEHLADFVALGGSCDGGACLPTGSPCDASGIPCCS